MIAVLKALGVTGVVAVEPDEQRRHAAHTVGATEAIGVGDGPSAGFDVVLEAAGARGSLVEAMRLAARGAVVVAAGLPATTVDHVDQQQLVMRELTVHGSVSHAWRFPAAAALLAAGRIDPALLVSGTYAVDDLAEALVVARTGGAGKLMLVHPDRVG
jgi:threonine dehydrogenase-like Zn-dependent dehydrogenase